MMRVLYFMVASSGDEKTAVCVIIRSGTTRLVTVLRFNDFSFLGKVETGVNVLVARDFKIN